MVEISKKLKDNNLTKNLIPYTSVGRLCFSKSFDLTEDNLPCIYYQNNKPGSKKIIVSEYNGQILAERNIDNMIKQFISIINIRQ